MRSFGHGSYVDDSQLLFLLLLVLVLCIIAITVVTVGHHLVWPAVCSSRGFVRALGFHVTLRATPAGSCEALGLRRTHISYP